MRGGAAGWEFFKCNRKPITVGVLLCRWDVD